MRAPRYSQQGQSIDSARKPRYVSNVLTPSPKLRPFVAHIDRGSGVPMIAVRGRIEDDVFRISVFGSEVALLPMEVASDEHGSFAVLPSGEQRFSNGLVLSVRAQRPRPPPKKGKAPGNPTRLLLSLRSESPAMPQAKALFGKLGGDAELVRMIAPSHWSIDLTFDADGRYLERAPARPSGSA